MSMLQSAAGLSYVGGDSRSLAFLGRLEIEQLFRLGTIKPVLYRYRSPRSAFHNLRERLDQLGVGGFMYMVKEDLMRESACS